MGRLLLMHLTER